MTKRELVLANMPAALPRDRGDRNEPGIICLANEARFTAANFSEPLTTYAVGWQDPENIQATLDALFPPVQVSRRFEYKSAVNARAFLSEADDVRAIGAPFKRVEYPGTSVNERTQNKGLTFRLDHDDATPGDETSIVGRLMGRLWRNDLRRGVALIIAAATNVAKTWDTTAGKDPDQDVLSQLILSGDTRGIDSNFVCYGQTAWSKRVLSHRAQNLKGQGMSASMSPAELAQFLGVDEVLLSKERYQSGAATKSKIVNAYVLMYYRLLTAGKEDPSNTKNFWTPTESGRVRVYREERSKWTDISVEHYSKPTITSTLGIRMLTIS